MRGIPETCECGTKMRVRKGRYGKFWFCPNAQTDLMWGHPTKNWRPQFDRTKQGHAYVWTGGVLTHAIGTPP